MSVASTHGAVIPRSDGDGLIDSEVESRLG